VQQKVYNFIGFLEMKIYGAKKSSNHMHLTIHSYMQPAMIVGGENNFRAPRMNKVRLMHTKGNEEFFKCSKESVILKQTR